MVLVKVKMLLYYISILRNFFLTKRKPEMHGGIYKLDGAGESENSLYYISILRSSFLTKKNPGGNI